MSRSTESYVQARNGESEILISIARSSLVVFLLALISIVVLHPATAQGTLELRYDNGTQANWWTFPFPPSGNEYGVMFSIPSGLHSIMLLTAGYYLSTTSPMVTTFRVHVYAADGSTDLCYPLIVNPPADAGWFDVDLRPCHVTTSSDFYVSIEYQANDDPSLGQDSQANWSGHSRNRVSGSDWVDPHANLMIRAVVEEGPSVAAVGGTVVPENKFVAVAPYLALLGLVTALTFLLPLLVMLKLRKGRGNSWKH